MMIIWFALVTTATDNHRLERKRRTCIFENTFLGIQMDTFLQIDFHPRVFPSKFRYMLLTYAWLSTQKLWELKKIVSDTLPRDLGVQTGTNPKWLGPLIECFLKLKCFWAKYKSFNVTWTFAVACVKQNKAAGFCLIGPFLSLGRFIHNGTISGTQLQTNTVEEIFNKKTKIFF